MAERDQAMQVFVGALDRHPAHRDVLAEMLAALGEHDAERAARDLGVLEEHLVEVAHPVEQQAVRIGGFDLDVLLHHWSDAPGIRRGGAVRLRRGGFVAIVDLCEGHRAKLADAARVFMRRGA